MEMIENGDVENGNDQGQNGFHAYARNSDSKQ